MTNAHSDPSECDSISTRDYSLCTPDCFEGKTDAAGRLLEHADSIDPGLASAVILSKRDQLIANHYTAYGVRTVLTRLGYNLDELRASQ